MQDVFGGSSSSSQQSSEGGFQKLPPEIKQAFIEFSKAGQGMFGGGANQNMFKAPALFAGEQKAIDATNQGFAPTATSLQSDIAMQQNPFDQSVINEINRQSSGPNSVLQQNVSRAGQFGSNRQFLGANDIDLSRMNQIGQFKQNQFNTSLGNAMTVLPQARANDANAMLNVGGFQRGLETQNRQAPLSALQAWGTLLGVLPKDGGTSSQGTSSSSSSPGIMSYLV